MKELNLLVWLTRLGLSTALPAAVFSLFGIWLHRGRGWGIWTVWAGLILGMLYVIHSFRKLLKEMARMAQAGGREPPPAAFHEHK